MNIVLIGYRGTGKTAVGEILSERLKMPYVGMDSRIVEIAGMSIPEIVERHLVHPACDVAREEAQAG